MPDSLLDPIRRAQRRLNFVTILQRILVCSAGSVLLASVALLVLRLSGWAGSADLLLLGSLVGGLVLATGWTFLHHARPIDAALRLDQSLGLKDRLTTLLSISADHRDGAAAQALVREASAHVDGLDIAAAVPLRLPRSAWWSSAPLLLYLGIALGLGPVPSSTQAEASSTEEHRNVSQNVRELEKKLADRRQEMKAEGLDEKLAAVGAEIEKAAAEIRTNPKTNAEEAALKLSDLAQALEKRQEDSSSLQQMKRSLAQLPRGEEGPARKLEQSLRDGDFKQASEALQEMKKTLAGGNLSPEEKRKLAEQLKRLEEQLQKAAKLAERAKQIQKDLPPELAQKELDKLAQEAKNLEQLEELAKSLGECSKCLSREGNQGETQSASSTESNGTSKEDMLKQLENAERMLKEWAENDAERQMIDKMLQDLEQCRGGVCRKPGQNEGMGKGRGQGDRPEKEDETRSRFSKANSQPTKGKSFVTGKTSGPIFKGDSQEEIKEAVAAARRDADDAITHQPIPPEYREHAREYFEKLNGQQSSEK